MLIIKKFLFYKGAYQIIVKELTDEEVKKIWYNTKFEKPDIFGLNITERFMASWYNLQGYNVLRNMRAEKGEADFTLELRVKDNIKDFIIKNIRVFSEIKSYTDGIRMSQMEWLFKKSFENCIEVVFLDNNKIKEICDIL